MSLDIISEILSASSPEMERAGHNLDAQDELIKMMVAARTNAGISAEDAAEAIGVSEEVFRSMEDGREDISLADLRFWANAIRVRVTYRLEIARQLPPEVVEASAHAWRRVGVQYDWGGQQQLERIPRSEMFRLLREQGANRSPALFLSSQLFDE